MSSGRIGLSPVDSNHFNEAKIFDDALSEGDRLSDSSIDADNKEKLIVNLIINDNTGSLHEEFFNNSIIGESAWESSSVLDSLLSILPQSSHSSSVLHKSTSLTPDTYDRKWDSVLEIVVVWSLFPGSQT